MTTMACAGRDSLAACHGFLVVAEHGTVGEVETPLFPPDSREPDYLVLRARGFLHVRRPVVSVALVARVDAEQQTVFVRGSAREIASLPEHLPLAL